MHNDVDSIFWHNNHTVGYFYHHKELFSSEDTLEIIAKAYGCGEATDTVYLFLDDCDCEFFIPNSFSPNGDESNDNLHIKHECIFDDFEFRIYNRWGEVIFTAYDPDFIWQGTNGLGELVQFGTYVWKARYRLADDIERVHVKERTGHINVIR